LIKIHELYDNKNLYLTHTSDIWITFSFLIKKPNLKHSKERYLITTYYGHLLIKYFRDPKIFQ